MGHFLHCDPFCRGTQLVHMTANCLDMPADNVKTPSVVALHNHTPVWMSSASHMLLLCCPSQCLHALQLLEPTDLQPVRKGGRIPMWSVASGACFSNACLCCSHWGWQTCNRSCKQHWRRTSSYGQLHQQRALVPPLRAAVQGKTP